MNFIEGIRFLAPFNKKAARVIAIAAMGLACVFHPVRVWLVGQLMEYSISVGDRVSAPLNEANRMLLVTRPSPMFVLPSAPAMPTPATDPSLPLILSNPGTLRAAKDHIGH